jgi:hypothetical protein
MWVLCSNTKENLKKMDGMIAKLDYELLELRAKEGNLAMACSPIDGESLLSDLP